MELENCPICGRPMSEGTSYALQDGEVCLPCSRELRFLRPYQYLPHRPGRYPDLTLLPEYPELTKKELTMLRKHTETFGLSGAYNDGTPERQKSQSDTYIACFRVDPLCLLSLKEFREAMISADAREDRIREGYLDYTNVCTVDFARPLRRPIGKPGLQNLRKHRRGYCLTGMIRAGSFREGDMVGILHNGEIRHADILVLYPENLTRDPELGELRTGRAESFGDIGETGTRIGAGIQVTMVLNEKAFGLEAGDLIVLDE